MPAECCESFAGTDVRGETIPDSRSWCWSTSVRSSVCLSGAHLERLELTRERKDQGSPKLEGWMSPGWQMLRPKVCHIFRTGRPTNFKLGTRMENDDQYHRQGPCWQGPWPSMSKIKVARSHNAYDMCWPISQERKIPETQKIGRKVAPTRATTGTSFKVIGQRSRSRQMLTPKVCHIFRTGRLTNLKLCTQMKYEAPFHWQAPWPPKSKVKFAMSRGASDICREQKVPETPKLVWRLPTPRK